MTTKTSVGTITLGTISLVVLFLAPVIQANEAKLPDDTIVYYGSGKRCHVVGCSRLTNDPEELAKMTKMTLAEAKAKAQAELK
jgi:hypothetical protein